MVRAPQSLGSSLLSVLLMGMMVVYAKAETIYAEKGKSVALKPTTETSGITSIMWKHGTDYAADWDQKDGSNGTCYSKFKGRCEVDLSTGTLTITGLTSEDTGDFSVDINYVAAGKFDLKIMSPVAQPSVNKQCEPELTYCLLTCEGQTPDAEPITYRWPGVDGHSDRVLNITKDVKMESFICVMENHISNRSSESIPNPFKSLTTAKTEVWVPVVVVLVLVVVVVLAVLAFRYFFQKGKSGKGTINGKGNKDRGSYEGVPTGESTNQGASDIELGNLSPVNHTHSNGNVPGEGANHSPSPVRPQNGPQRAEVVNVEDENPEQNRPAPASQGTKEQDEIANVEVENPDQNGPAPASQGTKEQDEIAKVEVENPDQNGPAPASQDATEEDEVINVEDENPEQNRPAPASQGTKEQDEIAKVEVENPDQNGPAPASQDATEEDETLH